MHTVESIKAAAQAGVIPDAFGRMIRGARIDLNAHAVLYALVDSGTREVMFILNGTVVSEDWLARVLSDMWRQQGDTDNT